MTTARPMIIIGVLVSYDDNAKYWFARFELDGKPHDVFLNRDECRILEGDPENPVLGDTPPERIPSMFKGETRVLMQVEARERGLYARRWAPLPLTPADSDKLITPARTQESQRIEPMPTIETGTLVSWDKDRGFGIALVGEGTPQLRVLLHYKTRRLVKSSRNTDIITGERLSPTAPHPTGKSKVLIQMVGGSKGLRAIAWGVLPKAK